MKKILSLLMVLILVVSVSLIACGADGDKEEGTGETTPVKTTPAKTTPTKTVAEQEESPQPTSEAEEEEEAKPTATKETPTGGDDLSQIFEKMPKCVQATLVITSPDQPEMQQKLWLKEKKYRTEMMIEGQEMITLMDLKEGVMYSSMPDMGKWMRMTIDPGEIQTMYKETIRDCDPKVIGSDTYDGKSCTVVQYNCGGLETKTWIWKEKSWPLKEEMQDPNSGVTTIIYKDLSFSCASDSLFELPAGAEVMDMDEMMEGFEGLGGEGMPGGDFELPEGFEMPEGFPMPQ